MSDHNANSSDHGVPGGDDYFDDADRQQEFDTQPLTPRERHSPGPDAQTPRRGAADAQTGDGRSRGGLAQSSSTDKEEGGAEAPPLGQGSGVMMGLSDSGKTFLLLSIAQACWMQERLDYDLKFKPGNAEVSDLVAKSVDYITGRDSRRQATTTVNNYSFLIKARATVLASFGRTRKIEQSIFFNMKDGPGGALFPTVEDSAADRTELDREQDGRKPHEKKSQRELERAIRQARTIILCVDASSEEKAQADVLMREFQRLLTKTMIDSAERNGSRGLPAFLSRAFKRNGHNPAFADPFLGVDRFLLLLNKIDTLCAGDENPRKAALMIDPVEQARHMLGIPVLKMIKDALHPKASFAVGVTSALGFHRASGEPLADENGLVGVGAAEIGANILAQWTPFGVRDALFYITTGYATGRVKLVTPYDVLYSDDEHYELIPKDRQRGKAAF